MPEMPEVEGLRTFLEAQLVGRTVVRTELVAFSALKTFALPLSGLEGLEVDAVVRHGKFVAIEADGVWLAFHLARAGWLKWLDPAPVTPAKPGRGPLALRVVFGGDGEGPAADGVGFDGVAGLDHFDEVAKGRIGGRLRDGEAFNGIGGTRGGHVD